MKKNTRSRVSPPNHLRTHHAGPAVHDRPGGLGLTRLLLAAVMLALGWPPSSFGAGAPTLIPGFLKFEAYTNIPTTTVQTLLDDPSYPNSPAATLYMTAFDTRTVYADDSHENYGGRITGLITPQQSGNYELFLRSDDASQLFISTDDNPANLSAAPIAEEFGCCNAFLETGATQTSQPVALVAGKSYAVQVLYKEAGGGDFAQVAWRREGDTTPAATLKPIPGAFLSALIPAGGSITVTKQPADVTAAQNDFITLTTDATNTLSPLVVQWQKNGVSLPGVTGKSVVLGPLAPSDNGAKFRAIFSIPGATTNSSEAMLTLTTDVTPPKIASVIGSDTFDTITLNFSEAVTAASAGAKANYSSDGGLTISAVTVVSPTQVRLTTSKQTIGASYNLSVADIVDTAGVKIAASTKQAFTAFTTVRGGLKFEAFFDIPTTSVQNLLDDPKYQANTPDVIAYVSQFTSRLAFPDSSHENYGGRLSGWIVPTETAQYEFFIRSDDASQLFLSPDDNPANAVVIAEETGCCGAFEEPGLPETSAPQALTAGKRYYIMALWKEGGGGDYCDVAWRKVGDTSVARALPYIQGTVLETIAADGTFTPPAISISSPASDSSFDVGLPVTFTATATVAAGKTITKVEFFELTRLVGTAASAPFSITISDLSQDVHKFTARVTDSAGIFTDSAVVNVAIGGLQKKLTLLAIDDKTTWRYDRSGQDLGTEWRAVSYNDAAWPQGKTLIADETTTTVEPIRTPISRFTDDNVYIKTFYFRTRFNFPGSPASGTKLQLRHAVDDAAVFYLNGVEIHRFGIAQGVVVDATTDGGGHENAYEGPFDIAVSNLVSGDNVLAVEVHQSGGSSSDMVFGAELVATIPAVTQNLLAIDDKTTWRYDRSGRDLGTEWRSSAYNDAAWPQGKTLIADETTTTVEPIRTPISRFTDDNVYIKTFYFRTHFNFPGELAQAKLKLRHAVDDAAVFYLNGVEIHRFGIAQGVVVDATTDGGGHENAYEGPFDIALDNLLAGDNVLAAEVHQSGGSSSDMVFGAELQATYFPASGTVTPPPSIKLTVARTANNLSIGWSPAGGTLQQTSSLTPLITWTDVGGANPATVSLGTANTYFRVKQ